MKKDEKGYIVVETIGAFMLFVFLMVSILSLINIVTVQARIHTAITQTANAISMSSYVLHVTGGLSDVIMENDENRNEVDGKISEFKNELTNIMTGINDINISGVVDGSSASADMIIEFGENVSENPEDMLGLLISYGGDVGFDFIIGKIISPITERYLRTEKLSAEEYLLSSNVIGGLDGLDFSKSNILDAEGDLIIVVEYEIKYKFGSLPLPIDLKMHIEQSAKTKAWLGGAGDGYNFSK